MSNILQMIEDKVSPKYLIYLKMNDYKLFKNIDKEESSLSTDLIDNKIFEVFETVEQKNEVLYLIGADNNKLGWITAENPILILNSFSELVSVDGSLNENDLNNALGIVNKLSKNKMYTVKYICNYKGEIYSGLENDYEFVGFYPVNILDYGNIEKNNFIFKNSIVKVYESVDMMKSQMIVSDNQEYSTMKYYSNLKKGTVKIGEKTYWFKLEDTTLDQDKIVTIPKGIEEYYLEHLIQSIRIEKSLQVRGQVSTGAINQEYVKNLNDRTKQLKDKNEEQLELNRNLNKKLKEIQLELKRSISKVSYLERLTNNQKEKLNYYEERNYKLEKRVELLEGKLKTVNTELKELKNGKLIKIQSKLFGK